MTPSRAAIKITIIYMVIGLVWILFSDRALELLVDDPATMMRMQTLKGWAYVLVTGVLFGLLAWVMLRKQRELHDFDTLTGLLNWYMFREAVDAQLLSAKLNNQQLGVAVINLDGFRQLNSQIGQRAGDALLQHVAGTIRSSFPTHATLGRVAADEFCIALRGDDIQRQIIDLIDRLQKELQPSLSHLQTTDAKQSVSCSAGIAVFPQDARQPKELITAANLALAEAKEKGQGHVCTYRQAYSDNVSRRATLVRDLDNTLSRQSNPATTADASKTNPLYLAYQPQFSDPKGNMTSVEVLLRWAHPLHGNISPDAFIELAEQEGFIGKLTDYVCRTAVAELGTSGLIDTLDYVSINVSAHDINSATANEDFARRFEHDAATKQLVEAGKIQLEITETSVMQDKQQALRLLQTLKKRGYRISVDDFGTGYSSLSVISRLPVDELKIDRSFVTHLREDSNDYLIVRTIIAMAHALDLQVVAEGLENDAQLRLLQNLRCDKLQGYLLGRPVPLAQLKALHGTGHTST